MTSVLIAHGIYGHPGENWFPWIKDELEREDIQAMIPHLPTNDPLALDDWWAAVKEYEGHLGKDTILIGHSVGVAFLLSVLERYPARAAFFVASAWGKTHNEFTPVMAPIADQPFQWDRIRDHCHTFTVYHADNDPYLPLERGQTLAEHLGCPLTIISGAGHFNTSSGYTRFDRLLWDLHRVLGKELT